MIRTGLPSQGVDLEAQPEDSGGSVRTTSKRTFAREGATSGPTGGTKSDGEAEGEDQAGPPALSQTQNQEEGSSDSIENDRPGDTARQQSAKMPRMVGDFDDSANSLWSLHAKEAKSHDEARIQSLKDNMDGVLIFAGLFSAALTAFIIDRIQGLRVDPAQQMVYYQQQNVALLAQISQQISSIVPHVSIPSTLPPPYPEFSPSSSDIRVNAYWFMSLAFSLSAALLATLVQQWVRDYMHVFQRYSHPLKSVRLRQYLYEGAEGWYMPVVAESVPGLVHMSLFLFFLGLGDLLLTLNTTIGITTIIPIAVCSLLYTFSMFASVLYPQSPFRNSFSSLIWYLVQKVYSRRYLDRAFGSAHKPVSLNMFEGQMQLAMEENDGRQWRDVRAIQWLIQTLTEDIEVESSVLAIPGSFSTEWGIEVWRKASDVKQYGEANPGSNTPVVEFQTDADISVSTLLPHGSPHPQHTSYLHNLFYRFGCTIGIRTLDNASHDVTAIRSTLRLPTGGQASDHPHTSADLAVHELCRRVQHLFDTCKNRSLFANDDLWRRRARACTETAASFVCCTDIKLELFGDIGRLLSDLGKVEKIQELSAAGSDGSFVTRWTCLSLVAIRGMVNADLIREHAGEAIATLSRFQFQTEGDGDPTNEGDDNENALKNARKIDGYFETTNWFCVFGLDMALRSLKDDRTEEQVRKALARDYEADISRLERLGSEAVHMTAIDSAISLVDRTIRGVTRNLIIHLPGISFDGFKGTEPIPPSQLFTSAVTEGRSVAPQLIFLPQRLQHLCSYAPKLRDIIEGRSKMQKMSESLSTIQDDAHRRGSIIHERKLMERQLWRLQDLCHGGGFGFSVELFFLALARLFSTMSSPRSSPNSNSALYIGTFKVITSDWRQHKHSIGTQRVILDLVCDIASYGRGIFSDHDYPSYITEELLVLLGNMVEGQSGSHINDAMEQLNDPSTWIDEDSGFAREAIKVISRLRTPASSP